VLKEGTEEDIWTHEDLSNRRLEKRAQWGASKFVVFIEVYYIDQIKKNEMDEV